MATAKRLSAVQRARRRYDALVVRGARSRAVSRARNALVRREAVASDRSERQRRQATVDAWIDEAPARFASALPEFAAGTEARP